MVCWSRKRGEASGKQFVRTPLQKMNYYNYFTEIEDTFVRRRGKHLLLSPLDWALIETWREQGIPLHIVIRGIEQVFDNFEKNPRPRSIKGLMFCREEVEAQYEEWLKGQAGKEAASEQTEENASPDEIKGHLAGLIAALQRNANPALADDISRAVARLSELLENLPASNETVDKSLGDIEAMLDAALLEKSEPAVIKRIENEVNSHLQSYRRTMEAAAFAHTKRLLMLKFLREKEGIPRLSLFYV